MKTSYRPLTFYVFLSLVACLFCSSAKASGQVYVDYSSSNDYKVLQPSFGNAIKAQDKTTEDLIIQNGQNAYYYVHIVPQGAGPNSSNLSGIVIRHTYTGVSGLPAAVSGGTFDHCNNPLSVDSHNGIARTQALTVTGCTFLSSPASLNAPAAVSASGNVFNASGLYLTGSNPGSDVSVTGNSFAGGSTAQIGGSLGQLSMSGNTSGDGTPAPFYLSGSLSKTSAWNPEPGIHLRSYGLTVAAGATLSLGAGLVIQEYQINYGQYPNFTIQGDLRGPATGSPAILTTLSDASPYGGTDGFSNVDSWGGIAYGTGLTANLSGITIKHASVGLTADTANLNNCTFTQNNTGVLVSKGGGVYRNCSFTQNGIAVQNNSTNDVDARGNWWGDPTGPYNATNNPNGRGNPVSDHVNVAPFPPTTLTVANAAGTPGQKVTLSATLKESGGSGLSGGKVTFSVEGAAVGTGITNSTGIAILAYSIPASLTVGGHILTAAFAGDSINGSSSATGTLTVSKYATSLPVSAITGSPGQAVTLKATLKRTAGGTAVVGETVTFNLDGMAVGTAVTTSVGLASLPYVIPAGDAIGSAHPVSASFAGDAGNNASSGSATLTVSKYSTSLTVAAVSAVPGQTVTLKATLKRTVGGLALSGATVTFTVDGAAIGGAVTNSAGLASLTYVVPAGATLSSHPVTAIFAGDSSNSPGTGKGTLAVKNATALAVANVTGTHGTTVTLLATLTGGGVSLSGKTVTFKVDGAAAGVAVTNSTGAASLPYAIPTTSKVGAHAVSASFAGDSTDNAANSTGTLTVN